MSTNSNPEPSGVLPPERFKGTLDNGTRVVPVEFTVSAGVDCRLVFDVDPGGVEVGRLAFDFRSLPGEILDEISLRGENGKGYRIESDSVTINHHSHGSHGHKVGFEAAAATITIPMEQEQDTALRQWFRSFKSFRNAPIETPLGTLYVNGATKPQDRDEMSGDVTIVAPPGAVTDDWLGRADAFLLYMHRGIGFMFGGRLQTPRVDYYRGKIARHTFYAGEAFRSEFPVQHQLNHDPMLKALVDRYFDVGPIPEVIWTALGWMQSDTTFDELRFLTAMTALETLIETELSAKRGTTIAKSDFAELRTSLEAAVDGSSLSSDEKAIFRQRVSGLNRRSFREKIDALFHHYRIPRDDFDAAAIKSLVDLRNDIVHRGQISETDKAWPKIILVRELIVRILLSVIGFEGRYCCYIGGLHDREFKLADLPTEAGD